MNAITTTAVQRIQELAAELDQLGKTALEKAAEAGRLLAECKAGLKHGEWLPWLKSNFTFSERTAQYWMTIAKAQERGDLKSATVADLGIREAIKLARPEKELTDLELRDKLVSEIDKRIDTLLAPPRLEVEIPGAAQIFFCKSG